MKQNKAPGNYQLTWDIIKLGGNESLSQITNNLKNKEIPTEWKEAKVIILYRKGERRDLKKLRPNQSPIPHVQIVYKIPSKENGENFRC